LPVCGLVLMFVVDVYVERFLHRTERKSEKKEKTDKFSFDGFPFFSSFIPQPTSDRTENDGKVFSAV
jgi:hypothetical protein